MTIPLTSPSSISTQKKDEPDPSTTIYPIKLSHITSEKTSESSSSEELDQDILLLASTTSLPLELSTLIINFKQDIVMKIIPGLHKEGYEESPIPPPPPLFSSTSPSHPLPEGEREPIYDPLRDYNHPSRPYIPQYPSPGFGYDEESRNPYTIGDRDLDPFAAAPGMVGGGIRRLPRFPGPAFGSGIGGGGDNGGGMVVGPDHPIFGGRSIDTGEGGNGFGPEGGNGRLPP